jgi:hypothetical protein
MLSEKALRRHPQAGTIYYWALDIVLVTMSTLAISRWDEDFTSSRWALCHSSLLRLPAVCLAL